VTEDPVTERHQATDDASAAGMGTRFGPWALRRRRPVPPADLTTGAGGPWRRRADDAPLGLAGGRSGPLGGGRRPLAPTPEADGLGLPAVDAPAPQTPAPQTRAPQTPATQAPATLPLADPADLLLGDAAGTVPGLPGPGVEHDATIPALGPGPRLPEPGSLPGPDQLELGFPGVAPAPAPDLAAPPGLLAPEPEPAGGLPDIQPRPPEPLRHNPATGRAGAGMGADLRISGDRIGTVVPFAARAGAPHGPPGGPPTGNVITPPLTGDQTPGRVPMSPVVPPIPAPLRPAGPFDLPTDPGLERTTELSELGPDYSEGFGADLPVLVRPYIRTGGRTRGPADLGIETLVSVNPSGPEEQLNPDHRAIVEMCARPRSVAEVAALNKMPIGVAKVLLADLARVGVIRIHNQAGTGGGPGQSSTGNHRPDLALMERVLAGLRKL
jgi:Protein of unknown function (DUF742)